MPASRSSVAEKVMEIFDCEPLNVWTPFCTTEAGRRRQRRLCKVSSTEENGQIFDQQTLLLHWKLGIELTFTNRTKQWLYILYPIREFTRFLFLLSVPKTKFKLISAYHVLAKLKLWFDWKLGIELTCKNRIKQWLFSLFTIRNYPLVILEIFYCRLFLIS